MPIPAPLTFWPLRFGDNNSDRVQIASAANITNLDPYTVIVLIYPTVFAGGAQMIGKGQATGNTRHISLRQAGTLGDMAVTVDRATTDMTYSTNDTPLKLLRWNWVAQSFNSANAAGDVMRFYVGYQLGLRFTGFSVASQAAPTEGSGAFQSDSGQTLNIMNNSGNTSAAIGSCAYAAVSSAELTIADLNEIAINPLLVRGNRGIWCPGLNGTSAVPDVSGNANHGSVVGAVPAGLPVPFPTHTMEAA